MASFSPIKFYLIGLVIFIFLFILIWWPSATIYLTVTSEPLIVNFEIKLAAGVENILFNLNTIPAKIVDYADKEKLGDYQFIDELTDPERGKAVTFQENDLEKIIQYRIESLLENSRQDQSVFESRKRVLNIHPDKWTIKVLEKDIQGGRAKIQVSIQEEVIRVYDTESIKSEVIGGVIADLENQIKDLAGVQNARINHQPKFSKRFPIFPQRIKIVITAGNI